MGLTFTAVDFETANTERASVCAAGIAVVEDGEVVYTDTRLIYPPTGLDFTNSWVHGITADDVVEASEWDDAANHILEHARDSPLVAYSPFDKGVWNAAWKAVEQPAPSIEFLDALALVKVLLPALDGYKLPPVTKHLELPRFNHHEAGADALACANIVLALSRGANDVRELWEPLATRQRSARTYAPATPLPETNTAADSSHPLYGEAVCFSGDLATYSRVEARKLCANLGATITSTVTKKTSLLVVGNFDPSTLKEGASMSSKVQRALDLAATGQRIEVIPETIFVELIDYQGH